MRERLNQIRSAAGFAMGRGPRETAARPGAASVMDPAPQESASGDRGRGRLREGRTGRGLGHASLPVTPRCAGAPLQYDRAAEVDPKQIHNRFEKETSMRKQGMGVLAAVVALMGIAMVMAGEGAPASQPHAAGSGKMPSGKIEGVVSMSATVDMIDQKNRIVTLRGSDGYAQDFVAGPEVRNLAQVKPGDKVNVKYYEAIAWEVKKAGSTPSDMSVTEGVVRAKEGSMPAGAAGKKVSVTAKITAIDTAQGTVTLTGPAGNSFRVKARDPKNLTMVKVGDMVDITYTQAMVIDVEPGGKM
jgi:hypothetical protein